VGSEGFEPSTNGLYGPEKAAMDKSWKLADIEILN
jgi:hypothetical protein